MIPGAAHKHQRARLAPTGKQRRHKERKKPWYHNFENITLGQEPERRNFKESLHTVCLRAWLRILKASDALLEDHVITPSAAGAVILKSLCAEAINRQNR